MSKIVTAEQNFQKWLGSYRQIYVQCKKSQCNKNCATKLSKVVETLEIDAALNGYCVTKNGAKVVGSCVMMSDQIEDQI